MAVNNNKIINFEKESEYLKEKNAGNILDTSIVLVDDTGEIHSHNTTFGGRKYENATQEKEGLMSASDKQKLDSFQIPNNYQHVIYDYFANTTEQESTTMGNILAGNGYENFRYYDTKFFGNRTSTAARFQVAYPYHPTGIDQHIRWRIYFNGWNGWHVLANTTDIPTNVSQLTNDTVKKVYVSGFPTSNGGTISFQSGGDATNATQFFNLVAGYYKGEIQDIILYIGTPTNVTRRVNFINVYQPTTSQYLILIFDPVSTSTMRRIILVSTTGSLGMANSSTQALSLNIDDAPIVALNDINGDNETPDVISDEINNNE